MRHENKFVFEGSLYEDILTRIMLSPSFFSEIYYERQVNNIYLDSFEYANYYSNINGAKERIKQRIRWYGNTLEAKNPVLEYKIKHGELGYKEYYKMPDFTLNEAFAYDRYLMEINKMAGTLNDAAYFNMYSDIFSLIPTLYNTYNRRYFMSADGKYRLTIDTEMIFHSIDNEFKFPFTKSTDDLVVEMKYEDEDKDGAAAVIQGLGFRLDKNSKYVTGISGLYF